MSVFVMWPESAKTGIWTVLLGGKYMWVAVAGGVVVGNTWSNAIFCGWNPSNYG